MEGNRDIVDIHRFHKGMRTDMQPGLSDQESYWLAENMSLVQDKDMYALTQWGYELSYSNVLPAGFQWHSSWSCQATYGPEREIRPSVICFAQNDFGSAVILIFDSIAERFHLVYSDLARPVRERMYVLDLQEIDAYVHGEGDEIACYWVDSKNPPRSIPLHVEDENVYDNSVAGLSPLYVPNEPDCLLLQRLNPVDQASVSAVLANRGVLGSGSYQFGYRYFNTKNKKYSAVSLLTSPVPIIRQDTSQTLVNDIRGNGLDEATNKAIEVQIPKSHFHSHYYNAIQLFIVRRIGTAVEMRMLPPSTEYYGSPGTTSTILFTGKEPDEIATVEEFAIAESYIETAKTLEVSEGRLYLANPKYANLDFEMSADVSGRVITNPLPVNTNPLESAGQNAAGQGYYDEMNCANYRGYWRGEVYQFLVSYFDKFARIGVEEPIRFPLVGNRYNPANHAGTWDMNWVADGCTDWKFPSRNSQQGSLFDVATDSIRPFGLRISGVMDHPEWAYGVGIFRQKRDRNIIGQSPLLQAIAACGNASAIDRSAFTPRSPYWEYAEGYDYDGSENTFLPKMMATGHSKSFLVRDIGTTYVNVIDTALNHDPSDGVANTTPSGLVRPTIPMGYLYPLEYVANSNGAYLPEEFAGEEYRLEVIDAVAMAMKVFEPGSGPSADYIFGAIFSPRRKESYYYYNQPSPGDIPFISNQSTLTKDLFLQVAGGEPITMATVAGDSPQVAAIRKIDNLTELSRRQAEPFDGADGLSTLQVIFAGIDFPSRAVIAITKELIADPTRRTRNAPTIDWETWFSPNIPQPPIEAITEPSTFTLLIPDGSTQVVPIVNITKGISDFRYSGGSANQYIFTGAYQKITATQVANRAPLSFDVWGGDCYISRLITKPRVTAPVEGRFYLTNDGNTQINGGGLNSVDRLCSQIRHIEIVDLWVESEVNGHYVSNYSDAYPFGMYTTAQAESQLFSSRQRIPLPHLYNSGYSSENDIVSVFTEDIRTSRKDAIKERIHFSTQAIANSSTEGFDRFLANDFVDLDGSFGGIQRLVRLDNRRVLAFQENAIAVLSLGISVVEDADALAIALSSGRVIGQVSYISSNSHNAGDFGIQSLMGAVHTEAGVIGWDQARDQIFIVSDTPKSLSFGVVQALMRSSISMPQGYSFPGEVVSFYDPMKKRVVFYSSGGQVGLSFNVGLGVFESIIVSPATLKAAAFSDGKMMYFSRLSNGGASAVKDVQVGIVPFLKGTVFGEEAQSYFVFHVSGSNSRGMSKVLKTVGVAASAAPTIIAAEGISPSDPQRLEARVDDDVSLRQDIYHANNFTDPQTGRRLRSPYFRIYVYGPTGLPQPDWLVRHVVAKMRLDFRQK